MRAEYGISSKDFVFIYSGRIDIYKGVWELVKAFKKINREDVKLLVVGKSWFGEENVKDEYTCKVQKEAEKVRNKIIFTGFVNPDKMPLMYQIADCLVVPSIWEEPFGVVALEGMASGLPLIVTNSGGLPEIVNDKCAVIVNKEKDIVNNLTDEMNKMMINEAKAKKMGECARETVQSNLEYDSRNYFGLFLKKTIG